MTWVLNRIVFVRSTAYRVVVEDVRTVQVVGRFVSQASLYATEQKFIRIISSSSRLAVRTLVLAAAILALLAGAAGLTARAHMAAAASHERGVSTADHAVSPDLTVSARVKERYGHLPLSFEANHSQTDSKVKFLSRGGGYSLFLTSTEAVLVLSQSEAHGSREASRVARTTVGAMHRKSAVVRMTLVNANPQSEGAGHDELPGESHYLIGNDPATWRTNVSTYAKVKYEGVYAGVDLVYYGNQGRLEYDFVLAPGADPGLVTLAFEGTRDVHIDARGDLVLSVEGGGEVRQHKPVVYQERAGIKQEVAGRYVMKGTRQVGFHVAAYDPSRPLIIDPVLVYSTYLGGGPRIADSDDSGGDIAMDGAGSAYVTGTTNSSDFPTTAGAFQTTPGGDFTLSLPSWTRQDPGWSIRRTWAAASLMGAVASPWTARVAPT